MLTLRNAQLSVAVDPFGAELKAITSRDGREWLWNGDATFWTGIAPILFPVVGRSPANRITIAGRGFPMNSHGFARNSRFEVVRAETASCLLRLSQSETTLASYPFWFDLDIACALEGGTLSFEARVTNTGQDTMPFCIGFHPAFRWPLPGCEGLPHMCWLDTDEEPRTRRLGDDGMLNAEPEPSVFRKGVMTVEHQLFDRDAVILDQLQSRNVSFGVVGRAELVMDFDGFQQFGIWTKPGAPYLCLEPWHGLAAEREAGPAIEKRPGVILLPPGEARAFTMRVTLPA